MKRKMGKERTVEEFLLDEITQGKGVYYIPQERAFAPGISGEWPTIIPHPTSKHGRLIKRQWPIKNK